MIDSSEAAGQLLYQQALTSTAASSTNAAAAVFSELDSIIDWPVTSAPGPYSSSTYTAASIIGTGMDKSCPPAVVVAHPFAGNNTAAASGSGAILADHAGLLYGTHRRQHRYGYASGSHDTAGHGSAGQAHHAYQVQQQQQQLLHQHQQQQAAVVAAAANAQQQLLLARLQQQQQAAAAAAAATAASCAFGGSTNASINDTTRVQQQGISLSAMMQQQQQQAMLAAHAASAAEAAAGRHLYGHYRNSTTVQRAAASVAAADNSISASMNQGLTSSHHYHKQQQQQQLRGAAGMPPRPSALHSKDQQCHDECQQQQQHSGAGSSQRSSGMRWPASSSGAGGAGATGGRWSGPVAVMQLSTSSAECSPSQQSDAGTGSDPALECDEELQSVDVCGSAHQSSQQQQPSQAARRNSGSKMHQVQQTQAAPAAAAATSGQLYDLTEGYGDSGSIQADDDDADNSCDLDDMDQDLQQQQQQQQHDDPAQHSVVLQVLGQTAVMRKGAHVLTAQPAAAEAAGAASVQPRLLITEVSLYLDGSASSRLALEQSNRLMARMTLPDCVSFMPVSSNSFLFRAAAAWQFPAFVICLGSSYLQRMMERLPQLADAALACPGFEDYCSFLNNKPAVLPPRFCGPEAVATLSMLRSVQFTCLFLATKVADQVHALGLLRFMLSHLSINQQVVSLETAADVEARCLETLGWRLGPFFLDDDQLTGNDEALWASAMGHWDYGSDADLLA